MVGRFWPATRAMPVTWLVGEEGRVIRLELIPLVYYGTVTGLLALVFVRALSGGVLTARDGTPPRRGRVRRYGGATPANRRLHHRLFETLTP